MSKELVHNPKIVYEDKALLVVNKPVGLVSTRADTVKEKTLQDWVEAKQEAFVSSIANSEVNWPPAEAAKNKGDIAEEFVERAGIVHRLDRETSGLIIISKDVNSYLFLKQQFKERKVKKQYVALVYGGFESQTGVVRKPVGRSKFSPQNMAVRLNGKKAVTYWTRLAGFPNLEEAKRCLHFDPYSLRLLRSCDINDGSFSFMELFPKTGRTHQIRVHLVSINHPVVGDPDYSGRKRYARDADVFGRMMLHAQSVGFIHPGTKAWLRITC